MSEVGQFSEGYAVLYDGDCDGIGGNCFTILIATIHPMKEHYEECLGTLQFANRCRSVQNQASSSLGLYCRNDRVLNQLLLTQCRNSPA